MKKTLALVIGIMGILLLAGNAHAIVVTDSLVSWWRLDETEGINADDSWSSNDGILLNFSDGWTTDTPGSGSSGALEFDGLDDYVEVADDETLDISNYLTVEAWFKTPDNDRQMITSHHSSDANGGWYLATFTDDQLRFKAIDSTGTAVTLTTGFTYDDNQWRHIVGTYDGNDMKIYINGTLIDTYHQSSTALRVNDTDNLRIGNYTGPSWEFNGSIDDVRIYNRALTLEEIQQNYAAMLTTIPEPSALLLLGMGLSGLFVFRRRIG